MDPSLLFGGRIDVVQFSAFVVISMAFVFMSVRFSFSWRFAFGYVWVCWSLGCSRVICRLLGLDILLALRSHYRCHSDIDYVCRRHLGWCYLRGFSVLGLGIDVSCRGRFRLSLWPRLRFRLRLINHWSVCVCVCVCVCVSESACVERACPTICPG